MADFSKAIPLILLHEGGSYTDDPADPGGPTKWGITIPDLPPGAAAADIQALTAEQAQAIYLRKYWNPLRCDEIPSQKIADIFMDIGVAKGLQGTTDLIRAAMELPQKHVSWGRLDDETLNMIKVHSGALELQTCFDFLRGCSAARIARVRTSPELAKFLPGWLRRNDHNMAHILGLFMQW